MRLPILVLAAALCASAQPVSLGFKLGAPINDPRPDLFSSATNGRWTGGPSFEVHLPARLSLEVNALYRTERLETGFPVNFGPTLNTFDFKSTERKQHWDFPVLLKYRLPVKIGNATPFVSGGVLFNHQSTERLSRYACMGAAGSCLPPNSIEPRIGIENDNRLRVGPVLGTGLEFSVGRMKIAPEVRFSHHKDPNRNQVTALVGFRWGR